MFIYLQKQPFKTLFKSSYWLNLFPFNSSLNKSIIYLDNDERFEE